MAKPFLRMLVLAAALLLALNLLLFTYARSVVLPLLAAAGLLALLVGLGDTLAARLRVIAASALDRAGLGLMAGAAFFFIAASLRLLNRWSVALFLAAALANGAWRLRVALRSSASRAALAAFLARPATELAPFLPPLAYASLPPTFYDSLVNHLGIPNLYLQWGGFVATPHFVFANTFIYYEIALVPAVLLGELVPRLFHFLLGALFVLAVADEAASGWGVRRKAPLVAALVSLPMTLFLLATCKNDLPAALFIFLGIRRFRRGDWKLSAAFWGFAVGVKYFSLLPLAVFVLVAFRPWRKADLKKMAFGGLIVVAALAPLLLKNLHYTGNPVYPFLPGAFPTASWDAGLHSRFQAEVGATARTPADLLRLPYDLSFFNHGFGGLVGPFFLIFLPFLLLGPVADKRWLAWALLFLAVAPFFTSCLRYAFAAFVVLAIFAVRAWEAAGGRLLRALFALVVAVNFLLGFAMLEKFYQAHALWGGGSSLREYRDRLVPAYPAVAFLNAHAPAGARVLLIGEARGYYLKRPFVISSAYDRPLVRRYLGATRDAGSFVAAVRADGFSFLLVNFSEVERLQAAYSLLTSAEREKLLRFLGAMTPDFRQGPLAVYRLN